jgi:predicted Fe-Mo cluster-binding NifX family protein
MTSEPSDVLSRRKFLTTAALGGLALTASAVGGAIVGSQNAQSAAEAELVQLRARLEKYGHLIALYEQLEKVGIDTIVATGMNVMRGALDALRAGIQILRAGIVTVENALTNFWTLLQALRSPADLVARVLTDLVQKFQAAESVIKSVLGTAQPLAEAIAGFFDALLQKIPIVGPEIRRATLALSELVRAIPIVIDAVMNQLLKPLRENFFPATGDPKIKLDLIEPAQKSLLEPLKKFLDDVESTLARWETDFVKPVQTALDERARIRKQIAEVYRDIGLA